MDFHFFCHFSPRKQTRKLPEQTRKSAEQTRKFPEWISDSFLCIFRQFKLKIALFESWLKGCTVNMNSKSFLSSSSTLAEGLDLMAAPMEDVVGKKFPLDDEEKELKLRLEAIPSLALIFFPNIPSH